MESVSPQRLNVMIAHAEHLISAGIIYALQQEPDVRLTLRAPDDTSPHADVVITDYADGMRMVARLRSIGPGAPASRLMVVTSHDREHEVRQALEAGIHGYLLANCQTDELVRCVRVLGRGSRYVSMTVAQRMADSMTREALTAREVDVLRLLARGQCNKSIALKLDIAVGTVKAHVKAIMGKLEASSRTHAVSVANERGLVKDCDDGGSVTLRNCLPRRPAPLDSDLLAA